MNPAADAGHRGLFAEAPIAVPLAIVVLIGGGLIIDARFGWPGQIAVVAWTFAVFAWLFRRSGTSERRVLILCTLISGIGEVFLSLVWGLYDYQFHNVPLFVPPGHALLMTLGLIAMRRVGPVFIALVTALAALWALRAWQVDSDRFGALLFTLYLLCVCVSRARALYAAMFVIALAMELHGTALGNWRWQPAAPWLDLSQANPPFSAGAFYCALDLLVLAGLRQWGRIFPAPEGKSQGLAGLSAQNALERRASP